MRTYHLIFCFLLSFAVARANNQEQQDSINIDLQEVVATGARNTTDSRLLPMTVNVVGSSQLEETNSTSVLPVINSQVPGIFITQRGILGYGVSTGGSGGIKIRGIGGSPNTDILVLIDGLPQYAGLYGHPIADNYQTMLAQQVEIIRGPASIFYGSNAMGGVMNIITRQPTKDTVMTNLHLQGGSYYTLDAGITNQVKYKKFSSAIGFNYSRTNGHRANMDFDEYNAFVKLGYDFTKHWKAVALGNIAYFNSSNPGTVSAPIEDNDMHILRGTASLSIENSYEKTSGAIRAYYNGGRHKINDGYRPQNSESPQQKLYLHTDIMMGVSIYQAFAFFKGNTTTFGFDYQHFGGHAWNESIIPNMPDNDIIKKSQDQVAGYIDLRQHALSWLSIDAGFRLDWHSQSGLAYIPQAGISFILPKSAQIKLIANRGFRNPTIRELYMYKPANDQLKAESLWNYELSYKQYLYDNRIRIGANVFYLYADNMIETRITDGKQQNVNTGQIHNTGFEIEFSYTIIKGLNFSTNYSFLHMKEKQLAAPEHKLNAAITYHHDKFRIGTDIQYIAGLYTALQPDMIKENYVLWNAHAAVRIYKGLWANLQAENLLCQKYEITQGFPMPPATIIGGVSWHF